MYSREEGASCIRLGYYTLGVDGVHCSLHGAVAASQPIAESVNSFF